MNFEEFTQVVEKISRVWPAFAQWLHDMDDAGGHLREWYSRFEEFAVGDAFEAIRKKSYATVGQFGHRTMFEDLLRDLRAMAASQSYKADTASNIEAAHRPQSAMAVAHNSQQEMRMYETIANQVYAKWNIPRGAAHPTPMVTAKNRGIDQEVKSEIRDRFREWVREATGVAL